MTTIRKILAEIAELGPNNIETQRLGYAVRTGIISAALMGISIGILFGLTHSAQIGAALIHAIDIYGDSTLITFDPGSLMIASIVSIIPAVIGGRRSRSGHRRFNPGSLAEAERGSTTAGWIGHCNRRRRR